MSVEQARAELAKPKPRPSKYRNVMTVVDGIRFHSKKEASRYVVLKQAQRSGLISDLTLQPKFKLCVNGILVCDFIPDFAYVENGERIYEDTKSKPTEANRVFRLKRRLFQALYPNERLRIV